MTTAVPSRSRYIPWLFVAGFAVVVTVNATMITFAVGSFSGLYTAKPRERGLHYNDVVARDGKFCMALNGGTAPGDGDARQKCFGGSVTRLSRFVNNWATFESPKC